MRGLGPLGKSWRFSGGVDGGGGREWHYRNERSIARHLRVGRRGLGDQRVKKWASQECFLG